jgi:hypothetical protein
MQKSAIKTLYKDQFANVIENFNFAEKLNSNQLLTYKILYYKQQNKKKHLKYIYAIKNLGH